MKKRNVLLLLFIGLVAFMQGQKRPQNYSKMEIESSKYWLDVDYVGDGIIGHRLDIHLPQEKKETYPVVLCIYGSAWFSNSSKASTFETGLGQVLLENGFAVVSINHRSSSDAVFPAQIHDVKAAIRFLRANADDFNLDTSFIGVTGWSSGGHLSALTGTTNGIKNYSIQEKSVDIAGVLGEHLDQSSHVNAVVDWFGPTNFLTMDACGSSFSHDAIKSPESSLIGGAIQDHLWECAIANPISYVKKENPPFLIFHGDKDPLVPDCQSKELYEKLQEKGVESSFVSIKDGGHGPGVLIPEYFNQMVQFFKDKIK